MKVLTTVILQTFVSQSAVAQTECSAVFVLTVACALMYHREVRFFLFPEEIYGRLLKLVDRTDLGSVGASHESSSLSPPTWIKLTGFVQEKCNDAGVAQW